jgi:hypothetical protein
MNINRMKAEGSGIPTLRARSEGMQTLRFPAASVWRNGFSRTMGVSAIPRPTE